MKSPYQRKVLNNLTKKLGSRSFRPWRGHTTIAFSLPSVIDDTKKFVFKLRTTQQTYEQIMLDLTYKEHKAAKNKLIFKNIIKTIKKLREKKP